MRKYWPFHLQSILSSSTSSIHPEASSLDTVHYLPSEFKTAVLRSVLIIKSATLMNIQQFDGDEEDFAICLQIKIIAGRRKTAQTDCSTSKTQHRRRKDSVDRFLEEQQRAASVIVHRLWLYFLLRGIGATLGKQWSSDQFGEVRNVNPIAMSSFFEVNWERTGQFTMRDG